MGPTGAGSGEHFGVQDGIDLYFGTFAKAMAGIGGFIACETDICYILRYNMRSQTFAKSLPMAMTIGALKRLDMIRTMPELREKLWTVVNALQGGLKEAGFDFRITSYNVCYTKLLRSFLIHRLGQALELGIAPAENH